MSEGDVSLIQDEDLLRKMWQQTDDFGRKKEIRAHMYRLREERLRSFYSSPEVDVAVTNVNTRDAAKGNQFSSPQSHTDSFAGQCFQSLKSKEVRDSGSPTRDYAYKMQVPESKDDHSGGWIVQKESKVSDDGHVVSQTSRSHMSGTKDIDGGKASFAGLNELQARVTSFDDDNSTFRKDETSSKSAKNENFAKESEDGSTFTSSSTSSQQYSSKTVKSSTNDAIDFGNDATSIVHDNSTKSSVIHDNTSSLLDKSATVDETMHNYIRTADQGKLTLRKIEHPDANTTVVTETRTLDDGTKVTSRKTETKGTAERIIDSDIIDLKSNVERTTADRNTEETTSKNDYTTTYQSDYTAKQRISTDLSPTHQAWASTLRADSPGPDRKSPPLRSSQSPDKTYPKRGRTGSPDKTDRRGSPAPSNFSTGTYTHDDDKSTSSRKTTTSTKYSSLDRSLRNASPTKQTHREKSPNTSDRSTRHTSPNKQTTPQRTMAPTKYSSPVRHTSPERMPRDKTSKSTTFEAHKTSTTTTKYSSTDRTARESSPTTRKSPMKTREPTAKYSSPDRTIRHTSPVKESIRKDMDSKHTTTKYSSPDRSVHRTSPVKETGKLPSREKSPVNHLLKTTRDNSSYEDQTTSKRSTTTTKYSSPDRSVRHPSPVKETGKLPSHEKSSVNHLLKTTREDQTSSKRTSTTKYSSPERSVRHTSPVKDTDKLPSRENSPVNHLLKTTRNSLAYEDQTTSKRSATTTKYSSPDRSVRHSSPIRETEKLPSREKSPVSHLLKTTRESSTCDDKTTSKYTTKYSSPDRSVRHTSPVKETEKLHREKSPESHLLKTTRDSSTYDNKTTSKYTTKYSSPDRSIRHTSPVNETEKPARDQLPSREKSPVSNLKTTRDSSNFEDETTSKYTITTKYTSPDRTISSREKSPVNHLKTTRDSPSHSPRYGSPAPSIPTDTETSKLTTTNVERHSSSPTRRSRDSSPTTSVSEIEFISTHQNVHLVTDLDESEIKKPKQRPPFIRSETYEERCRKILGMPDKKTLVKDAEKTLSEILSILPQNKSSGSSSVSPYSMSPERDTTPTPRKSPSPDRRVRIADTVDFITTEKIQEDHKLAKSRSPSPQKMRSASPSKFHTSVDFIATEKTREEEHHKLSTVTKARSPSPQKVVTQTKSRSPSPSKSPQKTTTVTKITETRTTSPKRKATEPIKRTSASPTKPSTPTKKIESRFIKTDLRKTITTSTSEKVKSVIESSSDTEQERITTTKRRKSIDKMKQNNIRAKPSSPSRPGTADNTAKITRTTSDITIKTQQRNAPVRIKSKPEINVTRTSSSRSMTSKQTTKSQLTSKPRSATSLNTNTDDNIVIDIQQAKSSRENSPDKICPLPVGPNEETGKPRFPDQVSEPDDYKPKTSNINVIHESDSLNSLSDSKIVEISDTDECLLSVNQKVSKFLIEAEKVSNPVPKDKNVDITNDSSLSVSDKVHKFLAASEKSTMKHTEVRRDSITKDTVSSHAKAFDSQSPNLKTPSSPKAVTTPLRSSEAVKKAKAVFENIVSQTTDAKPKEQKPGMKLTDIGVYKMKTDDTDVTSTVTDSEIDVEIDIAPNVKSDKVTYSKGTYNRPTNQPSNYTDSKRRVVSSPEPKAFEDSNKPKSVPSKFPKGQCTRFETKIEVISQPKVVPMKTTAPEPKPEEEEARHNTSRRGSGKFGVELRRTSTERSITERRRSSVNEPHLQPSIEDIQDLSLLDQMLERVVGYEQRRRIRAQIRLVKKNKETHTDTKQLTQTTRTAKTKSATTHSPTRRRSPEKKPVLNAEPSPERIRKQSPEKRLRPSSPAKSSPASKIKTTKYNDYTTAYMRKIGMDVEEKRNVNKTRTSPTKQTTSNLKHKSVVERSTVTTTESRSNGNKSPSPDVKRRLSQNDKLYRRSPSPDLKRPRDETPKTTEYQSSFTSWKNKSEPIDRSPKTKTVDDKPIWATTNVLRKVTESDTRRIVGKKAETEKTVKRAVSPSKAITKPTDLITSSYGVGPTDENGKPLFGIRALRLQNGNKNNNYEVKGTVVKKEFHSRNGGEPEGEISITAYSSRPEDLTRFAESHNIKQSLKENRDSRQGITSITATKKFGSSGNTISKIHPERAAILQGSDTLIDHDRKVVRQGSVKSLTEKFIKNAVETTKTEKDPYPKAGLILRSGRRSSGSLSSSSSTHDILADSNASITSEETSSFMHSQTETKVSSSFLDSNTKVAGVQDILSRMKNADIVIQEGDTSEDAEARALLNKFLGATCLMSGMESYVTQKPQSRQHVQETKTRTFTKTTSSGSKDVDLNSIWDERVLRNLLDECVDYERRRLIRVRLRQVMAEQEACAQIVADAVRGEPTTPTSPTATVVEQSSQETEKSTKVEGSTTKTVTTEKTTNVTSTKETKVSESTKRQATKPVSPFAKFKQLEKQHSAPASPSTPKTPLTPSGTQPLFRFTDPQLQASAATIKERLLQWCRDKTKEYENVKLDNFSTSWSDGLAFCALIHHFLPDAFDYAKLTAEKRRHNFTLAFKVADEKAGIFPLLDVDDMVAMKKPDWKCVFTYVQAIHRRFKDE